MSDTTTVPVEEPGKGRLVGATAGMAVGTTLSRVTGVGRVVALTLALGGGGFADAYNLANTTPNIITDIVIGGVLSATFVPVFVDRLATRNTREAWDAISAVVTATVAILVGATVAFLFLTPSIVGLYTATNHHADVGQQRDVAVFLLRWFVPQLACYGLIALFTALLNARGRFAMPMFVPIANNVIVIGILLWFHHLVPDPSLATAYVHRRGLVLLGLGTTLGVVVQALLLVPSLFRADLHLRFLWKPAHEAMRTIAHLASWTLGLVVANQVALVVILALADGAKVPGAVSSYTYAYTFFQLPYGVVAVSIMSAVTPSLSSRWARRDLPGFRHRMAFGLRGMLAIVIPSAVGMLLLAHPLIDLVLAHGAETSADASTTGTTLAMFSLGLPGFCTFLYMVRVFQSMQDTKTAFKLYVVENGINIVVGVILVGPLGVRGLALSVSVAYTAAALLAMAVVRQRVGGLGGHDLTTPVKRVLAATAVMAVVTVAALDVSGAPSGTGLLARVALAVVAGTLAYVGAAVVLGQFHARRTAGRPPDDRPPGGGGGRPRPPAPHRPPAPARPPSAPRGPSDHPPDLLPGPPPGLPPAGGPILPIVTPTGAPFHDRLDPSPGQAPRRHLRAVSAPSGGGPQPAAGGGAATDEEETDGPDPGGDR